MYNRKNGKAPEKLSHLTDTDGFQAVSSGKGVTFLSSKPQNLENLYVRIKVLMKDELLKSNLDNERSKILKAIQNDVFKEGFSEDNQQVQSDHQFILSSQEIEWLLHQSENLWIDYLIYRYRFKVYPRKKILTSFPTHLLIEPTSVCNLRCIMCFLADKEFTKKEYMGYMQWDLFLKIVEEVKHEKCRAVTLASRGEPTLHPKFGEMLLALREADVMDIKINTNATKLTEELCHNILEASVNEVVFSVDAGTKELYESIRVNGRFEDVVANIEMFHEIRAKHYKNSQSVTRVTGVIIFEEQDEHQITEFWRRYVDQVTIKRATPRWDSYNNVPTEINIPCSVLWERMYIWFNGKVNPCDFDYKSNLCAGNAYSESLKKIWMGKTYTNLRKRHLEKERKVFVPCDRCTIH